MAGAPASISILSGNGQSATLNAAFGAYCRVHVQDAQGNPCPNTEIWYECPRGGSGATGGFGPGKGATQNLYTDTNGNTDGGNTLYAIVNNGIWNLKVYVSGNSGLAVYFGLTNGTNVPVAISASGGSGQSANINTGFGSALKATVTDGLGLPVPGASVTFTLPTNPAVPIASGTFPGALSSSTVTTDVNGVATSPSVTANNTSGGWSASAKVVSNPALTCSYSMTNTVVLVPTNISISAGGGAQSANILQPFPNRVTVYVTDQFNNPVAGTGVDFTTPSQSGASGTMTQHFTTDAGGHAQSGTITANSHAGTWYGLCQLSVNGAISVGFGQMTNTTPVSPPTPTFMSISGGASQVSVPGSAYGPITVQVTDQFGSGIGATVTISVPSSLNGTFPGGLTSTTFNTNSSGVGTSPILTAGSNVGGFTVTLVGPQTVSTTFTTYAATTPYSQVTVSGNGQAAPPSTGYAAPLVVKVQNAVGAPLSGVSVVFTAPASGASLTFVATGTNTQTVTTDGSGFATTSAMTANALTGNVSVTAAVSGISNATFSLRNANTYGPVTCSGAAAPTAPSNSTDPTGANGRDWTNPLNAINTTGATCVLNGAQFSHYLNLMNPGAGVLGAIARNDRPTKLTVNVNVSYTVPVDKAGRMYIGIRFGAQLISTALILNPTTPITNLATGAVMDLSLFSPRPIGQDFIDGNVIPTIYCDLNGAGGSPTATVKSATWNLCYQPQGAYAPEVCTALTSAASGANVAVGTNALGAWSTPASAFLAHDTINYASVSVANPTSGQNTNWLVGTPQNSANLAAIDNNALISVVGFEFWADTVGLTNTGGQINAAIIIGGANFMNLTPATIALNVGVAWVLKSGTDLVIPSTAPITWAMFKAANCGVGLQWQSLGGNPNGSIKINGVRVKLCYTNPQSVGGGGMIWCEC